MKALVLIASFLTLAGCGRRGGKSKADVDVAAATHDPATLEMKVGVGSQVMCTPLASGIQAGIITLRDGERVKYWFESHHLSHDLGCTRFQYVDGSVDYLEGEFCCEVILPDDGLANRQALKQFITARDGTAP